MAIHTLQRLAIPKSMLAERMDPGAPPGVSVIGNANTVIEVQHQDADGVMRSTASIEAAHIPEVAVTGELPPDAGTRMTAPDVIQPPVQEAFPARVVRVGSKPPPLPQPLFPPTKTTAALPTPEPVPAVIHAAPAIKPPAAKVRVKLSNEGMGKITTSVRAVSISETCVILAYAADSDNIIEPPHAGTDNPITLEHDGKKYTCVFGGWTASLDDSFLVILLRAENAGA